jgi:hypothetical protein
MFKCLWDRHPVVASDGHAGSSSPRFSNCHSANAAKDILKILKHVSAGFEERLLRGTMEGRAARHPAHREHLHQLWLTAQLCPGFVPVWPSCPGSSLCGMQVVR